jgi:hypothetical protein
VFKVLAIAAGHRDIAHVAGLLPGAIVWMDAVSRSAMLAPSCTTRRSCVVTNIDAERAAIRQLMETNAPFSAAPRGQYSMPIDNQRDAAELRPEDLLCKSRAVNSPYCAFIIVSSHMCLLISLQLIRQDYLPRLEILWFVCVATCSVLASIAVITDIMSKRPFPDSTLSA